MGWFQSSKMVDGYSRLKVGMTKKQVISLLGQPSGQRVRNGIETLMWSSTEFRGIIRGCSMERKMVVDFKDDKVTGWDGQNMSASLW